MARSMVNSNSLRANHYFVQKRDNLVLKPKIIYAGAQVATDCNLNDFHEHPFCEILYVSEGEGIAVINKVEYKVQKGDLVLYNAKDDHNEYAENGKMSVIFFAVTNLHLPALQENFIRPEGTFPIVPTKEECEKIEGYFLELLQETRVQPLFYETMSQALVRTIIVNILRLISFQTNEIDSDDPFIKAKEYIDKNYHEPIKLDELCDSIYISKYYLSRNFKDHMGMSPIKYIIAKRIKEAKELLVDTDLLIKEIARKVGYEDEMYFSKIFKSNEGMSPIQYRNAMIKAR